MDQEAAPGGPEGVGEGEEVEQCGQDARGGREGCEAVLEEAAGLHLQEEGEQCGADVILTSKGGNRKFWKEGVERGLSDWMC